MTARERAKRIARGNPAAATLVCPVIVEQAAEIDAVPVDRFLTDPTKLANGLEALHRALDTEVILTASGDPALLRVPDRVDAAVEATRRLVATARHAAIGAALPGPSCGEELLPHIRAFLDAGAHLLLLVETGPIVAGEAWRARATTIANVARFRQAALAVVLADAADARWLPRGALACVPDPGPGQGLAWPADPSSWKLPEDPVPLVTTLGAAEGSFAELHRTMTGLSR